MRFSVSETKSRSSQPKAVAENVRRRLEEGWNFGSRRERLGGGFVRQVALETLLLQGKVVNRPLQCPAPPFGAGRTSIGTGAKMAA